MSIINTDGIIINSRYALLRDCQAQSNSSIQKRCFINTIVLVKIPTYIVILRFSTSGKSKEENDLFPLTSRSSYDLERRSTIKHTPEGERDSVMMTTGHKVPWE